MRPKQTIWTKPVVTLTILGALALATGAQAQVQDRSTSCTLLPDPLAKQPLRGDGKSVALLMQLAGKNRDVDDAVQVHLQSLGYTVTEVDQTAPTASLQGYALVVLSSSVSARYLRYTLRDLPAPVITWEYQMLDQLGMSGMRENADAGEVEKEHNLWLVNAPHPASGGMPAGKAAIYTTAAPMSWGRPGLGASTIATLPGQPEKVAIFTYERGATMDYEFLAPARRAFFPLTDRTFTNLNACGLRLFDAVVAWAASRQS